MSLLSRLGSHVEQYNLFELLCSSVYDMNPGILADSRSLEVDWSHCKSSQYHNDIEAGLVRLVICMEANVKRSRKRQNDGAVLADRTLPEVPVILVEGKSLS